MTALGDCTVCGSPAEIVDTFSLPAVGYDGEDTLVWFNKVRCALRHWYWQEVTT